MRINKEALREHYQRLADADIERLANYEAGDLRPEALDVLKEEIKRRGLSGELDTAVDVQVKGISAGADLLHSKSLYYSYVKPKPLLRRLISFGKTWPIYCERCAKPVSIGSIIMGIAISEKTLRAPAQSPAVQQLCNKDWSVLRSTNRPTDWFRGPTLRIELGRCNGCGGPFCSVGKVQGVASDGVLLLGAVFLGELDTLEAIALLETAIEGDLFANDDYLTRAIETCKALGSHKDFDRLVIDRDTRLAARRLGHRAMEDFQRGKLQQASEGLKRALETFTELGDKRDQSAAWMNLANVHIQMGDLDGAELQLRHSLSLTEELGAPTIAATCFGLLGTLHRRRGALDQAESMFRRALQIEIDAANKAGMATAYSELAEIYVAQNRHAQARDAYSEALELWQQLGATQTAESVKSALSRLST
jgi:tetratricopeptide (TPR) repeat protein